MPSRYSLPQTLKGPLNEAEMPTFTSSACATAVANITNIIARTPLDQRFMSLSSSVWRRFPCSTGATMVVTHVRERMLGCSSGPLLTLFPQAETLHFAGLGARQRRDELDVTGIFIRGDSCF